MPYSVKIRWMALLGIGLGCLATSGHGKMLDIIELQAYKADGERAKQAAVYEEARAPQGDDAAEMADDPSQVAEPSFQAGSERIPETTSFEQGLMQYSPAKQHRRLKRRS